ncbi:hypothetical protein [Pseudomonas aeruginosa]|uniref:hypothetical protein n=1 Tax=Pseudomonas aeruginosa TaxID=287 RepID=UPI0022B7166C|nr:hypothetical protein [Pseudomonas aeruginosa]MCZ7719925.1 hypothetical protein [Pseudomonas aeruginosa]MCZ7823871.1 hypothetical protein [Pseudomonas aeruginosa]
MEDRATGNLGEFYAGWQQYADAFRQACIDTGVVPLGIKPSNGYLRIDCGSLPEHLVVLADAVERATDGICQFCGATNAVEYVENAWAWKLCDSCQKARDQQVNNVLSHEK